MKQITFTLITLLFFINTNAKVWRINNTAGIDADFTTFLEAQEAASAGDTLMFEPSNQAYNTNDIDTLRKTLTLIGPGYFFSENYPDMSSYTVAQMNTLYIAPEAAGAVVTGMAFYDYNSGIRIDADNVVIDRNYIYGGITLAFSIPMANAVISRNFIGGTISSYGNYSNSTSTNSLICNNIICGRSNTAGFSLNSYSTASVINNYIGSFLRTSNSELKNNLILFVSYYYSGVTGSSYNNTFKNNVFGDELPESGVNNVVHSNFEVGLFAIDQEISDFNIDNEFLLSASSPALGVGEAGVDCGPFGGSNPYVLSGLPAVPVITEVIMPQSVTTELSISIKAKVQE